MVVVAISIVNSYKYIGQLIKAASGHHLPNFTLLPFLGSTCFLSLDCHFTQSVCLTSDNQILQWGWTMDQLTSTRTLNYYKKYPVFYIWMQKWVPGIWGMRSFMDQPNLMNKNLMDKYNIKKVVMGASFILAIDENGKLFTMGDNYGGQLGAGNVTYQSNFQPVLLMSKIVDLAAGFHHSVILTEFGSCYASGKKSQDQFQLESKPSQVSQSDYITQFQKLSIPQKVSQISCGFLHSVFLLQDGRLLTCGLNKHGQCGKNNLTNQTVSSYHEVYTGLEKGDRIKEVRCGKSHTVFLTEEGKLYFFGATMYNQTGGKRTLDLDWCSPQQIHIKMEQGEKLVRIKAGFDRTCAFTNFGNAYAFGGEDLQKIGEDYSQVLNLKQEIGLVGSEVIKDVGLGYLHTLVLVE